ncbi:DUF4179 domain-containing protein [Neobacillus jeddahensis]|uniref:DUF4179 domain-containing protein n=1 Tax=Neobacillus jeddahensis TaxID=1461580 RepID=UPI00058BF2E3|nr:DUF4179 domain-containing protein [Neobacillus jeddahensis]
MKDIYELLNDIDVDVTEFEEMEVTKLEIAKVKKSLKKSMNEKKKLKGLKKNLLAASIIVCFSAATVGLTFPAYAKNIPGINDIFRYFDNDRLAFINGTNENKSNATAEKQTGLYHDYKKYSSDINMTKESNGTKITIKEAVFDGKTVSITFSIESEQDLGEQATIFSPKIDGMNGTAGTSKISKIDKNKYVGILTMSNLEDKKLDRANIKWAIDHIQIDKQTSIKGDWPFAFSVKAVDSKVQENQGSAEKNGVKVNIEEITSTPMSFTVYYNQEVSELVSNIWDGVLVDLEIKDNLGNTYSGEDNGGVGDNYNVNLSKTFGKLDGKASKLMITPHVTFIDYNSSNHASVQITNDGPKEIPLPEKPGRGKQEFKLKDIIIEIK